VQLTTEYCAPVWCCSAHTHLIDHANDDTLWIVNWIPASYTSGQPSNPCRHPTCWALSHWSHTVSSTPCHGAWTSAPLNTHLSIKCKCMEPQIETPICTRCTRFRSSSDNNIRAALWADHQWNVEWAVNPTRLCIFIPDPGTSPQSDPSKKSLGLAKPPQHQHQAFLLMSVQMGYGLLCSLWVWCRRSNHWPCCPLSNPSTSSWTAQPDCSGRQDNRMAAQHVSWDLVQSNSG